MSAAQIWANIVAYTLQIGLLVGLGAAVTTVLRMPAGKEPRVRLLYWQMLLVACLALPWLRAWRQEVVSGATQVGITITAVASDSVPTHRSIPFAQIALWMLTAGVVIRLAWLGTGLVRLAAYRRRGRSLPPAPGMSDVRLLLSDDVAGPVTFGWRDPVVLLPDSFPALPDEMREAILCHEFLHVERRDWLFAMAEEMVRAVLWFHPAIWWVIGEIRLAREQTVDRSVIEMTRARGPYVDALLSMAGASPQLDLAPAPMFLRRRHLKRRLMDVMKEVSMTTISGTRLAFVTGAAAVILAAACWLATGAFPLVAAPQVVNDAAGVAVNTNGTALMHRASVPYPAEALAKGVEGTVVVQVKLDANGEVSDATVLSGPDELRKAVLQSVLTWHFDKSVASTTKTVNIDFVRPAASPTSTTPARASAPTPVFGVLPNYRTTAGSPPPPTSGKLDHIVVTGLSDSARSELLSHLPVQEGGEWTGEMFASVKQAVSQFDSHLTVSLARSGNGEFSLRIGVAPTAAPIAPVSTPATYTAAGVYSVGNGVSAPRLVSKVDPGYTEEARTAKLSGTVTLSIVVNTEGQAENIQVVKSLGMGLDEQAVASVQKWGFTPGMNQGVPVKTRATIEVNFRLLDKE